MGQVENAIIKSGLKFNRSYEMSIPKMKDQHNILILVSKALDYQFDCTYSWINMIDDIDGLTKAEKAWAKENISYKAYITGEDVHT